MVTSALTPNLLDWANEVPTREDAPNLYRALSYPIVREIACDGTLFNIHLQNAANQLDRILR